MADELTLVHASHNYYERTCKTPPVNACTYSQTPIQTNTRPKRLTLLSHYLLVLYIYRERNTTHILILIYSDVIFKNHH